MTVARRLADQRRKVVSEHLVSRAARRTAGSRAPRPSARPTRSNNHGPRPVTRHGPPVVCAPDAPPPVPRLERRFQVLVGRDRGQVPLTPSRPEFSAPGGRSAPGVGISTKPVILGSFPGINAYIFRSVRLNKHLHYVQAVKSK